MNRYTTLNGALCLLAALWCGAVIGVSFIATPVKFSAPSLDLAVALDVGRTTFAAFSRIEWGAAVALLLLTLTAGPTARALVLAGVLAVTLAAQGFWLLPILDARVAAIIAGTPLPSSWHHTAYGALELLKVALLLAIFVVALGRTRTASS